MSFTPRRSTTITEHWSIEGTPYVKQQRLSPTSQANYGSWDLDYVNITLGRFQ